MKPKIILIRCEVPEEINGRKISYPSIKIKAHDEIHNVIGILDFEIIDLPKDAGSKAEAERNRDLLIAFVKDWYKDNPLISEEKQLRMVDRFLKSYAASLNDEKTVIKAKALIRKSDNQWMLLTDDEENPFLIPITFPHPQAVSIERLEKVYRKIRWENYELIDIEISYQPKNTGRLNDTTSEPLPDAYQPKQEGKNG